MEFEREVITAHIGQAGIQMGHAIWEMISSEHCIGNDGKMNCTYDDHSKPSTFFQQSSCGNYVPRALFLDLEPNVLDEIKHGRSRNLFHPDSFIHALDDSANNFARAYYTTGSTIVSNYTEQLRRMVEQCDSIQAMMLVHAQGGGTGSGMCAHVMEYMSQEMGKTTKIEIPIFPSPIFSNAIVEPYNCVLSNHFCMEHSDITLLMDNEAMYENCMRHLGLQSPTFHHLNRIIAHVVSTLTCNIRFEGALRADLNQLCTNLVPYPRIHFLLTSCAPLLSADRVDREHLTVTEITRLAFHPECQIVKMEADMGKFMSVGLLYRGDVTPRSVNNAISKLKNESGISFVDWCPTGYKVSINAQPSTCVPGGMICKTPRFVQMLANNTIASHTFNRVANKFETLYQKRSFVHWYVGEGLEESELSEGVDNIRSLANDYKACGEATIEDIVDEDVSETMMPENVANLEAMEPVSSQHSKSAESPASQRVTDSFEKVSPDIAVSQSEAGSESIAAADTGAEEAEEVEEGEADEEDEGAEDANEDD